MRCASWSDVLYWRHVQAWCVSVALTAVLCTSPARAAADIAAPISASSQSQQFVALCYHAIPATANGSAGANSVTNFAGQLAWLLWNGYHPIRIDDVLQANAGVKPLPPKSVLLTVDDGYEDFYLNVFPLLKLYQVPVVLALVGRWIDQGRDPIVSATDPGYASQHFLSWQQVQEMAASGLVEMASHSDDLHHGILANPQGNTQPAAVTQAYDSLHHVYETLEQRRLRVRNDLRHSAAQIERHTGKKPRVIAWPYGAMDRIAVEAAADAGMPINLGLSDASADTNDIQVIPRKLIDLEVSLGHFTYMVSATAPLPDTEPVHAVRIDLDRIQDPDPREENNKLGRVLEQTALLGVNTVVLQPLTRGGREAYFPNSVLPVRADLLNRVAWQFRSRLGVGVFVSVDTAVVASASDSRDPVTRNKLLRLYREMSLAAPVQGWMFEGSTLDDARFRLNADLLAHSAFIRTPMLMHAAAGEKEIDAVLRLSAPYAGVAPSNRIVIPASAGVPKLRSGKTLPILRLPVQSSAQASLEDLAAHISRLQQQGAGDVLLDDDRFMDNPAQLELMSEVISLKNNPYVAGGK